MRSIIQDRRMATKDYQPPTDHPLLRGTLCASTGWFLGRKSQ